MVSNNRKGNLYMALICSPALKWHNMAEPTFAHFWMWSRCCLRHQVWRSEAASYVKNSGGRIAKNWNRCSISRLHGEMTCRILNWNVHEHNGHTTYRSLGQVLKVPHLARQKKCLKGRGRFFSKLWWNASGISSSSSAEIARKLPAVFAAQIDQQITFHNVQISNLHSFHLLPICCCLGGAFLSPTDATWPDQVNPLTWTNLSTPISSLGQPQDAAQHVVGSNAYKDTKGDGVPRIFQVDLQEMKMRITDTQQCCFVKEYMLQLSSRSLGSSLLEPSGPGNYFHFALAVDFLIAL